MKIVLDIQAAEGGNDAKLLVGDQSKIYLKFAEANHLSASVQEEHKSAHG